MSWAVLCCAKSGRPASNVPAIARREQTVAARIKDPVCDEGGGILLSVTEGVNPSRRSASKCDGDYNRSVIET